LKKILPLLLLTFSTTVYSNWTFVTKNDRGTEFSIDYSTLKVINGYKRVWLLMSHPDGFSMKNLNEFDCNQQKYRTISRVSYSEKNGFGEILNSSNKVSEWDYPVPGSVSQTIFKNICKK